MARGGSRKAQNQEELMLDSDAETPSAEHEAAGESAPAAPQSIAVELVSTLDGCWMVDERGKRRKLSEEEWRKELAHALARNRPATTP